MLLFRREGAETVSVVSKRVLIVDDHPIVREGIAQMLAQQPDLTICGSAVDGASARRATREQAPDVAVVDLSLGHESGLDLIPVLAEEAPTMPILILSMHDEALYAKRALQAGAHGYIMKHEGTDQLLRAIRTVLNGQIYVSAQINASLLRVFTRAKEPNAIAPGLPTELSNRELQIYRLIGDGLSTKAIAERLFLSTKTVESHRAHIKQKLGLDSTTALVLHAAKWLFGGRNLESGAEPVAIEHAPASGPHT